MIYGRLNRSMLCKFVVKDFFHEWNEMKFIESEWGRSGVDHPKRANESFHYSIMIVDTIWIFFSFSHVVRFISTRWNLSGMSLICLNEYFTRVIGSLLILNTFWLRRLLWSIQDFSDAYQNDKHLPGSVRQAPLIDLWSDWGEEVLFSEKRWNRLMKLLNWWVNEIQFGASEWSIKSTFLSWENRGPNGS